MPHFLNANSAQLRSLGLSLNLWGVVLNAVNKRYIGIASGVNDAVATVGSLVAVAVFGITVLTISVTALNRQLSSVQITAEVRSAIESAKGKIRQSLAAGIRGSMLLAAMLAVAGALVAALTVSPKPEISRAPTSRGG
jgi:hypothetical protein